ncbi:MAG: UDP-4-amino-4,6-dideoxy-N-acetyl-beta-L-altrosamine transaminase [Bacteroidota bacterium]
MIPYGKQFISEADIQAVVEVLRDPYLTQGPRIQAFEEKFAAYIGAKYAVAVANGTAALHLSALALGVNDHSRVITSPLTFAASANCVRYCGGRVEFADIDPSSLLLNLTAVREKLESAPKGTYRGIIPVDFAGYPVDLEAFREVADEYGCWLLEDACHAPGGYFVDSKGVQQPCGNGKYADLAIFSFHPVKHIATGEGGMITTDREDLYEKLKILRTHGITKRPDLMQENHGGWYYEMVDLGYNYRITDIQCALGISQLDRAKAGLQRRREIARVYDQAFADTPVKTIIAPEKYGHAYHLYVIQVSNRQALYQALRKENIFAQVHYIPLHTLPYYQKQGYKKGDFPVVETYYEGCLSLPMYPTLTDQEQAFVIDKVLNVAC